MALDPNWRNPAEESEESEESESSQPEAADMRTAAGGRQGHLEADRPEPYSEVLEIPNRVVGLDMMASVDSPLIEVTLDLRVTPEEATALQERLFE